MTAVVRVTEVPTVVRDEETGEVHVYSGSRDATALHGRQILLEVPANLDLLVWIAANSRYELKQISEIGDGFLALTGGTMTGPIVRATVASYYWGATGTAAVAEAGTYVKVSTADSTVAGETDGFTISTNNRATYTGATTAKFRVTYHWTATSESNNVVLAFQIAKNGTVIAATISGRKIGTNTDEGNMSTEWVIELATGDYVELWGTNESGTGDVMVKHGQCLIAEA